MLAWSQDIGNVRRDRMALTGRYPAVHLVDLFLHSSPRSRDAAANESGDHVAATAVQHGVTAMRQAAGRLAGGVPAAPARPAWGLRVDVRTTPRHVSEVLLLNRCPMTVRRPADSLASTAMNSIVPSPVNRLRAAMNHHAAYLILLGNSGTPKALLFNADHRYLSEVIDDGFIVDTLRSAGTRCPKPQTISLDGVVPESAQLTDADVLCFALGEAA